MNLNTDIVSPSSPINDSGSENSIVPETLLSTTTNIDTKQESIEKTPKNNTSTSTSNDLNIKKELKEADKISKVTVTESKKRIEVENPFLFIKPKATYLIYWENPIHSGAALAIGLLSLIFTSYYSLFDTFCFLFVSLAGLNMVYVVGRKQINSILNQESINPYEYYLSNKPWYIEYALVDKYIDGTINGINFILIETQKVILIDDALRSTKYTFLVYLVWKLSCWFNLHILLGIALVIGFSTPKLYLQNKVLVDEKLDQANKLTSVYYKRGIDVVNQNTGGMFSKFQSDNVIKNLTKSSIQKEE